MSGGFESFSNVRDIPFIARHASMSREEVCKRLKVPADKPIVLASFGGFGLPGLETDTLAKFKKYTVVTAVNLPLSRARKDTATERKGSYISVNEEAMYDSGVRYEDLVGAAEVVVTKPGYGIISECIANDTAILYTARGHFPEYDVLIEEMPKYLRSAFINQDDLFAGKWESYLDKLRSQPKPKKKPEINGADVAADILLKALDKPPKKPRGRPRTKI
jgi:L-arabinokinase